MMYSGLIVGGPRDGVFFTSDYVRARFAVEKKFEPAINIYVLATRERARPVEVEYFEYVWTSAVGYRHTSDTTNFWLPDEWMREGESRAVARAMWMLVQKYAARG